MNQKQTQKTTLTTPKIKWEVVYEDEDCISIWKYDIRKTRFGPYEVENKYKRGYVHPTFTKKSLGQLAKESKEKKASDL